ncbi:dipeptidase 1-like [Mytilus edulis]|uniref:dipeptidase 1-like n=1 Tax=Mytilus edulis TaxID=6550 RepID=UPI0039EE3B84
MEFHNLNEENSSTQALHVSKRKKKRQHVCIYGFLIAALIGIMIGLAVGIPLAKRDSPDQNVQEAQNVLKQYPLIDGHNDLPWQYRQYVQNKVYEVNLRADTRIQWTNTTNMTSYDFPRLPPQTDIPRLKQGMVGAQFWAAFGPCSAIGKDAIRIGMDQVDVIHKFVNKYDDTFELVTTAQGILDAYLSRNRIASLIGLEGGHMISNTLGVLRSFYSLGVRYMTLTHSCDTSWAENWKQDLNRTGSRRGLSEFGKIVVKEMNRLGMIIDLAHVAKQTMIDAIKTSAAPVIFSHSSAFEKCEHYRNVQNDVLELVKNNTGLVMINFYDGYISKGCLPVNATESTMQHVIDHINYIKDFIGVDFVGIGADYDGVPTLPVGLEDVSKYPDLFAKLREGGWSTDDLKKLAGENFIRVFKDVEKVKENQKTFQPYEDFLPEEEAVPDRMCYTSF